MSTPRTNLAAVPGITVGHVTIEAHGTGCTVVLAPETGMRAAACVRGRATGTRELDVMDPRHLVERIDAILFTGGSALGLGAADGVMRWLRERGRGLAVGDKGTIPIVPSAVIFDLGNAGKPLGWPSPDDAYRACDNATADFAEGRVGVGRGATCGKAAGLENMIPAGLGSWAAQFGAGRTPRRLRGVDVAERHRRYHVEPRCPGCAATPRQRSRAGRQSPADSGGGRRSGRGRDRGARAIAERAEDLGGARDRGTARRSARRIGTAGRLAADPRS